MSDFLLHSLLCTMSYYILGAVPFKKGAPLRKEKSMPTLSRMNYGALGGQENMIQGLFLSRRSRCGRQLLALDD